MVSVALAFAVLFKEDAVRGCFFVSMSHHGLQDKVGHEDSADDFDNFVRSVVTTYAILLGDFESAYVFDGSNKIVKGIFVLLFQVLMSITVLNLLIAVMTESYAWVCIALANWENTGCLDAGHNTIENSVQHGKS